MDCSMCTWIRPKQTCGPLGVRDEASLSNLVEIYRRICVKKTGHSVGILLLCKPGFCRWIRCINEWWLELLGGLTQLAWKSKREEEEEGHLQKTSQLLFHVWFTAMPLPWQETEKQFFFRFHFKSCLFCWVNKPICVTCYFSPLTFNTALPKRSLLLLAPNHRLWLSALLCGLTC